jgi:hypothetical protein
MVLETRIHLGSCLDLTQTKWVPFVRTAYDALVARSRRKNDRLAKNVGGKHFLDFQVVTHICDKQGKFDTVRCAFRDGARIYPGAEFYNLSQVMIAVSNPDMIVGPTEFVAQGI